MVTTRRASAFADMGGFGSCGIGPVSNSPRPGSLQHLTAIWRAP
jgi:hypothetical protein